MFRENAKIYGAGVCWKRGKWIFSLYRSIGDERATLKIRTVEVQTNKYAVNTPYTFTRQRGKTPPNPKNELIDYVITSE
ncbi:MAG: hypothetical protein QW717_03625 [Candidatus Bathyarchaeia archaeon]